MQKLDFREKLIQTGKRENTDALLKRIKSLHQKLALLEQDATDVTSLDPVRRPLINQVILHHKDRGVKAYAACCLADLLRLYAPDAPYTAEELRDIFQFFSAQLLVNLRPSTSQNRPLQPSRSKTNEASQHSQTLGAASQRVSDIPYYTEYCYLLESLATIKSVVLACDVPGGDDLVTGFFDGFVQIVRSDMSKNIIRHLVNILVAVVEESASIPSQVMDCIIDQFENHAKPDNPAFQMIVDVCNKASDRLQRPIFAHFSEIQLAHGRNPDSADMETLQQSHDLLLSLWRFAPGLLLNVVPLLEENLRAADEVILRQVTTRTLGSMFGERPRFGTNVADLARAFPSTWRAWIGRKVDKAVQVRLTWVESSRGVLLNAPDQRQELEASLLDRIQDSNEHVRAAICKVMGSLDYEMALHHVSSATLQAVGARMSDKKSIVRNEAASGLATLWNAAYSEIEANVPDAVEHFSWIPEAMLHCLHKKDAPIELRSQISSAFKNSILPLPAKPDDVQTWVDRLLLVATYLDDPAFGALESLIGLKGFARGGSPFRAFITFCEENNGGVIDKDEQMIKARLAFVINAIARQFFVDAEKAKKDMEAFAAANDHHLYKAFKNCVDPHSDLRTLIKSKNELSRRLQQSHTDILDTFTLLIEHASFNIVNTTSISPLLKKLQSPPSDARREPTSHAAARLLSLMAKECAPMYVGHVPELLVVLGQQRNEKSVEVGMQALAAVCKIDKSSAPVDRRVVDKVIKIALKGTPRQAKFAARFLAYSGHEEAPAELVESILDNLSDKKEERLLTYLRALTELALTSPAALEAKADEVHRFVMQDVIYNESPSGDDAADEWVDEDSLAISDRAKITALRLLTHRALGFARAENASQIAEPVLTLMDAIMKGDGQISAKTREGGHARTHLRLRAALCLLKLANVKAFDKKMTAFFEPITYIMQDPCYQVRHQLLIKLGEVLPAQRLLPRWNIMPAMIATDPEKDNPALARSIITSANKACGTMPSYERIDRIEMPLARLLLVLSHHPDLNEWSMAILKDMSMYIELYVDCVAHRDNVGLLYHIAGKVKSFKGLDTNDQAEQDNVNLYKLAELAQIMVKNRADMHHWTVTTYPGKVRFPKDIFHNLENNQTVMESTRKTYLTEEEATWARSLGRKPNAAAGPSRKVVDPSSSPVKKRARKVKNSTRKKARRTDDEDESSEESDEDEDENEEEEEKEAGEEDNELEEDDADEDEGGVIPVMGRGGRRGAKTKANKGLKGKASRTKKSKSPRSDKMDVDDVESELSD